MGQDERALIAQPVVDEPGASPLKVSETTLLLNPCGRRRGVTLAVNAKELFLEKETVGRRASACAGQYLPHCGLLIPVSTRRITCSGLPPVRQSSQLLAFLS